MLPEINISFVNSIQIVAERNNEVTDRILVPLTEVGEIFCPFDRKS